MTGLSMAPMLGPGRQRDDARLQQEGDGLREALASPLSFVPTEKQLHSPRPRPPCPLAPPPHWPPPRCPLSAPFVPSCPQGSSGLPGGSPARPPQVTTRGVWGPLWVTKVWQKGRAPGQGFAKDRLYDAAGLSWRATSTLARIPFSGGRRFNGIKGAFPGLSRTKGWSLCVLGREALGLGTWVLTHVATNSL